MHLRFTWPIVPNDAHRENFFMGGWHPTKPIRIECAEPPPSIKPVSIQSNNWFLISNTSPLHSIIHAERDSSGDCSDAVAFKGYVLDPPIHSYSLSKDILNYWLHTTSSEHNGVFSAACIKGSGKTLELINDAFGMAPLYYRSLGELILFATNPRYLVSYEDTPDYMAWRCLIQSGFIAADRILSATVKRIPAGHVLRFESGKTQRHVWFDYNTLPDGTKKVDDRAVIEVEESFQVALSRCLNLKSEGYFLPLSSGYDSRRILAGLIHRKVPFQASTVRVLQKQNRDLDAQFASLMAKEIGFAHYIIEPRNAQEYAADDYQRRILLDAESSQHTWAVSLMRSLPDYPTIFFDGLAGDVFGNANLIIPGLYTYFESDRVLLAHYYITNKYNKILNPSKWPSADVIRSEIISYIEPLPLGMNQATLAKLLLHTRRDIAPWAQQMLPAGHVAVYPYLDLDYTRLILTYNPVDKYRTPLQKACLEKYWPQYFEYPGSKAIPSDMPPGSPLSQNEKDIACFRKLEKELIENNGMSLLRGLLTKRANVKFWFALQNNSVALKSMWAFRSLMETVSHDVRKKTCWDIASDS